MSPQDHLLAWFTPQMRRMIRATELDRVAGRPYGTFSRFLACDPDVPLTNSIKTYYPALAIIGYVPPSLDQDPELSDSK